MKVDKKQPLHWLYLCAFLLNGVIGLIARLPLKRGARRPVIFYGHKLNGNLLALFERQREVQSDHAPVFLTMDRAYSQQLLDRGIASCWAGSWRCALLIARADALISDHGLHSLQILQQLLRRTGLRFFDVWHGIPFKGFDADDFRTQHAYDEIWVASELHRRLYIDRYGFTPDKVAVTGYARTDKLVAPARDATSIRQEIGAPSNGKLILFAPTWAQDTQSRSIFPFGHSAAEFLGPLSALAARHDAHVIVRQHLNTAIEATAYPNILFLPSSRYPDTESILLISDMLICDWSSIAFDYLLLDRPTFFLDVPAPFRKGFSLGPEYRFGPVTGSLNALLIELEECLQSPEKYWETNRSRHCRIREEIYGPWADGKAAERCLARMRQQAASPESSQ